MSATISIGGISATCENYVWRCEVPFLAAVLNSMLSAYGPSGSDPNPDYTAALKAVEELGGKITSFTPTEDKKGKLY